MLIWFISLKLDPFWKKKKTLTKQETGSLTWSQQPWKKAALKPSEHGALRAPILLTVSHISSSITRDSKLSLWWLEIQGWMISIKLLRSTPDGGLLQEKRFSKSCTNTCSRPWPTDHQKPFSSLIFIISFIFLRIVATVWKYLVFLSPSCNQ